MVYATVLRDVFDRKADCKELRMFSIGKTFREIHNQWIGYKSKIVIRKSDMFSSKGKDGNWSHVEQFILKSCFPLTILQRTADWFLMKSFRLTGTMASIIANNNVELNASYLTTTLNSCIKSWFGRHKANDSMQIGKDNENVTAQRFISQPYVKSFSNCGLLCSKLRQYIGVSPDGIAEIELPCGEIVICSVEIKTRVAEKQIAKALQAFEDYG